MNPDIVYHFIYSDNQESDGLHHQVISPNIESAWTRFKKERPMGRVVFMFTITRDYGIRVHYQE